jgi:hypothetical protein
MELNERINPPAVPRGHIPVPEGAPIIPGDMFWSENKWNVCSSFLMGKTAVSVGYVSRWIGAYGGRKHG